MDSGELSRRQRAALWSVVTLVIGLGVFSLVTDSGSASLAAQAPPAGGAAVQASTDTGASQAEPDALAGRGVVSAAAVPCLTIEKLAFPVEPVPATWDIHYSLIVRNGCSFDCTNIVVTDTKDSRTYYRESDPLFDNLIGQHTFVWHFGDLAPGRQRTALLRVVTGPSLANQTVRNEATVDSDQTAPMTVVRETRMGPMLPTDTPLPTLTATASPTPRPTLTPHSLPTVQLHLDPSSSTLAEGDLFEIVIRVEAGTQSVDGAEVHLNFDPVYLQVVDAAGNPATAIENSGVLNTLLLNQASNTTGHIDFAAGILEGTLPNGSFVLATVHLRALNDTGTGSTPVTFVTDLPRKSNVTHMGASVLAGVHNATVHIAGATPTPPTYRLFLPIIMRYVRGPD